MDTLYQDLRLAVRMLLRKPGSAAVVVLILGLGIGASAAMFSVVEAVLLRPLPYAASDRLVMVDANYLQLGMERIGASVPEFLGYRQGIAAFSSVAAFANVDQNLTGDENPERLSGARVSFELLPLLGSAPLLGRGITAEEEQPGKDGVVLLSHGLWRRRFGGDPAVVGRALLLDGRARTVVGILPADFVFPHPSLPFARPADVFIPFAPTADERRERSRYPLRVLARLRPAASLDGARAEMAAIGGRLEREFPDYRGPNGADGGFRLTVSPLEEVVVGDSGRTVLLLFAAGAVLLLVTCGNAANLQLGRGLPRQQEIAIRGALGAGPWRLLRQLLTESALLALLGAAVAVLLALWATDLLAGLGAVGIPRADEIRVDGRVLLFLLLTSGLAGIAFGLLPAARAFAPDPGALGQTRLLPVGRPRGNRVRHALVAFEVALSTLLLIGAALLVQSLWKVQRVDPGFDPGNTLTLDLSLPPSRYGEAARIADFQERLLGRVRSLSGVRAAGLVSLLPLSGSGFGGPFSIEGRPFDPTGAPPLCSYAVVSPGTFHALGVGLRRGRSLADTDDAQAPRAAIVNEALARTFFPDSEPLGQRIKLGAPGSPRPWLTVVGVVGNVGERSPEVTPQPAIYVSSIQEPRPDMSLVVRTSAEPLSLVGAVREQVRALDPDQPIDNVRTLDRILSNAFAERRLVALLIGAFAGSALLLAVAGLCAVISFSAGQRTRELGIRAALGAPRRDLVRLVMKGGLPSVLIGLAAGTLLGKGLTRLLGRLLYDVGPADPATFAGVAGLLGLVAVAACYVPARRAAGVDPVAALRVE